MYHMSRFRLLHYLYIVFLVRGINTNKPRNHKGYGV